MYGHIGTIRDYDLNMIATYSVQQNPMGPKDRTWV